MNQVYSQLLDRILSGDSKDANDAVVELAFHLEGYGGRPVDDLARSLFPNPPLYALKATPADLSELTSAITQWIDECRVSSEVAESLKWALGKISEGKK